jgi:GT2 family glycosyltransferase
LDSIYKNATSYKIIIVDSFYDDAIREQIKKVAAENDCDFVESVNKGYGYGNNKGIYHALSHYSFDYLIISNPDIVIKDLGEWPSSSEKYIIGPIVKSKSGRAQNPYLVSNSKVRNRFMQIGYEKQSDFFLCLGRTISRVQKVLYLGVTHISRQKMVFPFALHGSFLAFTKATLDALNPVFDENIFLFSEELDLGNKAKCANVKMVLDRTSRVLHNEDGSMKYENDSYLGNVEKESFLYVYNKWYV